MTTSLAPSTVTAAGPLRAWPVVWCYAYRALASALMATPLAITVATVVGGHPRGDGLLFDPGGLWLTEASRLSAKHLSSLVPFSGAIGLLAMFGWLLPMGALIASLEPSRPPMWAALGRSASRFGSLSLLMGVVLVLRVAIGVGFLMLGNIVGGDETSSVLRQVVGTVLPVSALLLWWLLDLFHDAIRVTRIHDDDGLWGSTKQGARLLWGHFGGALWAGGWRAAIGVSAFVAALIGGRMLTGGEGDRLVALVVVHQLAILVHVVVRGSWFRWLSRQLVSAPPTIKDRVSVVASTLRSPTEDRAHS